MGGSTAVNYMGFVRGNALDYDEWAALGNEGWGYHSLLPYFKKMEHVQIPELRNSPYHGTTGNIMNSYVYDNSLVNYTFETARLLNIPEVDYNGANQAGIARFQTTTYNGTRWSANRGYIAALRRKNLMVRQNALVSKVLIENGSAIGVEYLVDRTTRRVFADKEVIVSAGAINSPKLLMLSGVGPRDHLEELGIPVVIDLPVGRTLYDHLLFSGLVIKLNTSIETLLKTDDNAQYLADNADPLSGIPGIHVVRFYEVGEYAVNSSWPNMESLVSTQRFVTNRESAVAGFPEEFHRNFGALIANDTVIEVSVVNNKPRSKGTLTLHNTDVYSQPIIDPKYLSAEEDVAVSAEGIAEAARFFTSGAFARLGAQVHPTPVPKCEAHEVGTREYWSCALRRASATTFHPCCTCKMGPRSDPSVVVSPHLRVWGIDGLRVVDASVMPTIPTGHIQVPVYMIGEKGADLIKCTYLGQKHCS